MSLDDISKKINTPDTNPKNDSVNSAPLPERMINIVARRVTLMQESEEAFQNKNFILASELNEQAKSFGKEDTKALDKLSKAWTDNKNPKLVEIFKSMREYAEMSLEMDKKLKLETKISAPEENTTQQNTGDGKIEGTTKTSDELLAEIEKYAAEAGEHIDQAKAILQVPYITNDAEDEINKKYEKLSTQKQTEYRTAMNLYREALRKCDELNTQIDELEKNTTASVPFMITKAMEQELKDKGLSQEEIDKLTPVEAWDVINHLTEIRPATGAPEKTPTITPDADPEIESLKEEIRKNPDNIEAFYDLGFAFDNLHRKQEATEIFKKINELDPNNPVVIYNFGLMLHKEGKLDEAKAEYEKALALNPGYYLPQHNLNIVLNAIATRDGIATPGAAPVSPASGPRVPVTSPERVQFEQELEQARIKYAEAYKKFLADAGRLTQVKRFFAGGKIKNEDVPQDLKLLEENYNEATRKLGFTMLREKWDAIKDSTTMTDPQKEAEFARFKQNETFTRIIIEEQSRLNALKTENLPPKEKNLARKTLEWYMKLEPAWKKRAITLVLTTSVMTGGVFLFAPATLAAGGGIAAYAGTRVARSLGGTTVGLAAGKAFDYLFKNKSAQEKAASEKELSESQMFTDHLNIEETKANYAEIQEKEYRAKRNRLITKAMVTIAAGGLTSYEMGHLLNHGAVAEQIAGMQGKDIHLPNESHINENMSPIPNSPNSSSAFQSPISGSNTTEDAIREKIMEHLGGTPKTGAGEVVAEMKIEANGQGGIQQLINFKEQLRGQYPDLSKAPPGIKAFLDDHNALAQAEKFGLYDPSHAGESAQMVAGSSFSIDANGNLSYHDIASGKDFTEHYTGKMFDSDAHLQAPTSEPEIPTSESVNDEELVTTLNRLGFHGDYTNKEEVAEFFTNQQHVDSIPQETGMPTPDSGLKIPEAFPQNKLNLDLSGQNQGINPDGSHIHTEQILEKTNGLSTRSLAEVNKVFEQNLQNITNGSARTYLEEHGGNIAKKIFDNEKLATVPGEARMYNYLHKLAEVSGLKPHGGWFRQEETLIKYMARASQAIAKNGQLDRIRIKY